MTTAIVAPIQDSGLVVAAGTYDGVLAGWEFQAPSKNQKDLDDDIQAKKQLSLTFATAVHEGSIRSLTIAGSIKENEPGQLLSCGYDESLKTHDWHKRMTSSGEIRTPSDFGTPVCSAFAPPNSHSTHCLVGFSNGKLCIYKKRDWSVQHVLAGHEGGVGALAVHPSGKLALSGGVVDGKLKLWDLTKGRLAFVNKIDPASTRGGKAKYDPVSSLVWSKDGEFYAMSHGPRITVREVASGKTLLDADMLSQVNQVTLMVGPEGLFVAAACNDGSLPVLAVEDTDEESRRAIMAIEPVDSHLAREERFKCIQCVRDYIVVTANSAGVVSLMDLRGAVNMIMSGDEKPQGGEGDSDDEDSDNDEELELAVDMIESVQLGTGARITCLSAWCKTTECQLETVSEEIPSFTTEQQKKTDSQEKKRKQETIGDISLDAVALKKARSLVEKAKKLKKKREKNKKKLSN
ncbi:transcriptional repressor [Nitzschia inconspicua]|uniref:Transcriptional repressor n=1 Tax=Nitzschia inconspicua TaxID=303405 RepID=A0A9K3LHV8_9STRA|nr:transcriptional repressor [Nitzschia inconspicua]